MIIDRSSPLYRGAGGGPRLESYCPARPSPIPGPARRRRHGIEIAGAQGGGSSRPPAGHEAEAVAVPPPRPPSVGKAVRLLEKQGNQLRQLGEQQATNADVSQLKFQLAALSACWSLPCQATAAAAAAPPGSRTSVSAKKRAILGTGVN